MDSLGGSGVAAAHAHQSLGGAEHALGFEDFTGAIVMLELDRYRRLNLASRQARRQHRQLISQIDHGVDTAVEKVDFLHTESLRKYLHHYRFPRDLVYTIYTKI